MKPTSTVAEFIRRAREARHDSFGLANDLEASMALASVHRGTFVRERTEQSLRRWRELVAEVTAGPAPEPGAVRWLAIEHVRLGRGFKLLSVADQTLQADAVRWCGGIEPNERKEILERFELDLIAPLTEVGVASQR